MNCVNIGLACDPQDVLDIEVRFDRPFVASDEVGLVGFGPMERESIFLRIDRNGPDAELVCRPHDSNGDLAAIGHQETTDTVREGCHIMCVMKKCAKNAQTIANPPSGCRGNA